MNNLNKLPQFLLLLLIVSAASGQKTKATPLEVNRWINAELQRNSIRSSIDSYDKDDLFFSTDSATVMGYLKGYKPSEGFKTGMIYIENEFFRKDHPIAVKIFDDGRFEARIPMWYPKVVSLDFNNQWLEFYIEPGQALGIIINWAIFRKDEKADAIQFYGPLAGMNRSRNSILIPKTDDDWLAKEVRKTNLSSLRKRR